MKEILGKLNAMRIEELQVLVDRTCKIINEKRVGAFSERWREMRISVRADRAERLQTEILNSGDTVSASEIIDRALHLYFSEEAQYVMSLRWTEEALETLVEKIIFEKGYREMVADVGLNATELLIIASHHKEVEREVMAKLRNEMKR